jgi:hypothetical protein
VPRIGALFPPPRLCEEHADGDAIQLIKPPGQHAAMLSLKAVQIRAAHGAVTLSELQMPTRDVDGRS